MLAKSHEELLEIFAHNLKNYMKKSKKSRKNLVEDLDFKYTTVTEWVKGKKYPRIDKIEMLANYFGIKTSDLIEEKESLHPEDLLSPLTLEEEEHIKKYRRLDDDDKILIANLLQTLLAQKKYPN